MLNRVLKPPQFEHEQIKISYSDLSTYNFGEKHIFHIANLNRHWTRPTLIMWLLLDDNLCYVIWALSTAFHWMTIVVFWWYFIEICPRGPDNNNILELVQMFAFRLDSDKPLSEQMVVSLYMHICVTRPPWVNAVTSRYRQIYACEPNATVDDCGDH